MGVVILSPHQRRRPVRIRPERSIIYERRGGAVAVHVGFEPFRAFNVSVRNLEREVRSRIPGDSSAVGIESRPFEIVTVFVRLATGENAAFDFHRPPLQSGSRDSERHMCRILPMMSDRRVRIVHSRQPVHERGWTERRFARVTEI